MGGHRIYSSHGLQRLRAGEHLECELELKELFDQANPPPGSTAEWSNAVRALGLRCGDVYILRGGGGRGTLVIERKEFKQYVFFVY